MPYILGRDYYSFTNITLIELKREVNEHACYWIILEFFSFKLHQFRLLVFVQLTVKLRRVHASVKFSIVYQPNRYGQYQEFMLNLWYEKEYIQQME